MKLYGYTVVNTDSSFCPVMSNGVEDYGRESMTKLFQDENEMIKNAYEDYKEIFDECDFEDRKDANGELKLTFEDFKKEYPLLISIQAYDYHIHVEFLEFEI